MIVQIMENVSVVHVIVNQDSLVNLVKKKTVLITVPIMDFAKELINVNVSWAGKEKIVPSLSVKTIVLSMVNV
jgi:hypothetical protein